MKNWKAFLKNSLRGALVLALLLAVCWIMPALTARAVESNPAEEEEDIDLDELLKRIAELQKELGIDSDWEDPEDETDESEAETEPREPRDPFPVLFQPYSFDGITEDQQLVIVTQPFVNIREEADVNSPVLAIARQDQILVQTGSQRSGDGVLWYQVQAVGEEDQAEGFISSNMSRSVTLSARGDVYANYLRVLGFPDSYIPYLKELHAQYPNWLFKATETGLDWQSSVYEEANPPYYLGISLIHNYTWPNSYKSMKNDNFDWQANNFKAIYDGPGWTLASDALVAYHMDPRNFLKEDGIFQFLNLLFDENQTVAGVRAIVAGSFMEDGRQIYGEDFSYPELLYSVGKELGISPYYLASSIKQEIGMAGTSKSISGNSPTVSPGGVALQGYYNYYNVYAYTMMGMDANDVGLWFAEGQDMGNTDYNRPWNTREKAIKSGAMFHAYNYLLVQQNTLYYKRFNLFNGTYRHQYMTNIMGAYSESRHLSLAYDSVARQQVLRFDIPIYLNMPAAAAPQPSQDPNARENLNPNNRLKSIQVSGTLRNPSVNVNDTFYALAVKNSRPELKAETIDGGARVEGAGVLNLKEGENTVRLRVTAANGDTRDYTLSIFNGENVNLVYTSDMKSREGYWSGVDPGTTLAAFREKLQLASGASLRVLNADGQPKGEGELMKTGDQIQVFAPNGALYEQAVCLIYGDVNGDGKISGIDLISVRDIILGSFSVSGAYALAADVNIDKKVSGMDLITVRDHILGDYSIPQIK